MIPATSVVNTIDSKAGTTFSVNTVSLLFDVSQARLAANQCQLYCNLGALETDPDSLFATDFGSTPSPENMNFTFAQIGYAQTLPRGSMSKDMTGLWGTDTADSKRFETYEFPLLDSTKANPCYRVIHIGSGYLGGPGDTGVVTWYFGYGFEAVVVIPGEMRLSPSIYHDPTVITTVTGDTMVNVAVRPVSEWQMKASKQIGTKETKQRSGTSNSHGDPTRKEGGKVSGNDAPTTAIVHGIRSIMHEFEAGTAHGPCRWYWSTLPFSAFSDYLMAESWLQPVCAAYATGDLYQNGMFPKLLALYQNYETTLLEYGHKHIDLVEYPHYCLPNPLQPEKTGQTFPMLPSTIPIGAWYDQPDYRLEWSTPPAYEGDADSYHVLKSGPSYACASRRGFTTSTLH